MFDRKPNGVGLRSGTHCPPISISSECCWPAAPE
jgi:hypothetical protein